MRLVSAYDLHYPGQFFTTFKRRDVVNKRTIDYIWYSPACLTPTHLLSLPTEAELPEMLPAADYPSDHLALLAQFVLRV